MRSRLHDDIQRLHGTMPLWGIDHWVSLGDLFVDVNILELTSSNRRSELDDLWQDFTRNNSDYHSLDRIGLSNQLKRVSGLAVLERDTNLMVVGKPGSGKTTYLQRIVTECNEGKLKANLIPVLIKLREFVDDGCKYDYNLEQFLEHQWQLYDTDIELILNQGLALVLLDGLDEVVGEAGKQITQEIKRFARSYPQVQIIVTCRTQSQESKFDYFDYVEVADFNEKQVKAFAEHWFGTVCKYTEEGKTKAKDFVSQLFGSENKPIRELAITPILLSLTCAVFQQTGKFYSKRSKLYEEGLELLLESWDKSREVERDEIYRDLLVERKLELLSYLAVKKFEQEQYVLFEQEEIENYIGEFLGIEPQKSRGVLKAIESQHGLLIERARKIWSFSHLTFQEYLVAKWHIERKKWKELSSYFTEQRWKNVIKLAVESEEPVDKLVKGIKQEVDLLIASNLELQKLLEKIHQKTLFFKKKYKPVAIRGFYILLIEDIYCRNTIDPYLSIQRVLAWRLGVNLTFEESLNLVYSFDEQIGRIFEDDSSRRHETVPDKFWESEQPDSLPSLSPIQPIFNYFEYIDECHPEWLHPDKRNKFDEEFKTELDQYLRSYCEGNQFIIDILNRKLNINQKTRKFIERTLFLPLSKIKKNERSTLITIFMDRFKILKLNLAIGNFK